MIDNYESAVELAKDWEKLKTDKERLTFILKNRNNIMIHLDNDESHAGFITNEDLDDEIQDLILELESEMHSFDQYFGSNDGILMLFEFLNIRAEDV